MHNIIIGVIAVVLGLVALFVLYRIWTYKPTDAGEACGYCCIAFIATIFILASTVLLYAFLISLLL